MYSSISTRSARPGRLVAGVVFALCLLSGPASADVAADRRAFLSAVSLVGTDPSGHAGRRRALGDYILAPYLDYEYYTRNIATLGTENARSFLASEAGTQLGVQFRRAYLMELARRADWSAFLEFDLPEEFTSADLRCHRVQAYLGTRRIEEARREFLAVWPNGSSLPDVCDAAIGSARQRGWLDAGQVWTRLRLAVEAGNAGLASHLARQLPAGERDGGQRLALAVADPAATLRAAASWPDGPIEREAVTRALRRLARQDVATAASQWESLAARFSFAAGERSSVLHDIALQAAASYRPDAGRWFQQVPEEARSESLMEWELRAALAVRDWGGVLALVRGLSPELASAARSRYWQARALEETGANDDARALFAGLATEANFHGFLAADRLDAPYAICPEEIPAEPARLAALRGNGELARALELRAIGWQAHASRAWEHARRSASETDRRQMLLVASEEGWHDRAIYALNTGGDLRQYALRFPVAERDTVIRESSANGLDPAWTYALIRAESAWQPDARSGANAYGLMQLLPGTGQQMARQLGIPWSGTRMLLDPQANIRLGTRYLSQQAARFGGSPWLASAAYNAGPAAVQRWLDARHALPADVFIETIPYRETREYVMRVMAFSVIYDWRLSGKAHPLSARLPAPGSPWAPRDRGSPRTVTCPLPG